MESHKIHVPNHHPETHGDLGIPHKAPYISAGSASELQTKALESLLSQGPWKGRGNLLDRRLSWTTVKCATHQHHAMERHHVNGNIMCYLRSPKNPTFLSEMWLPNCSVENTKHWSKKLTWPPNLDPKEPGNPGVFKGASWEIPAKNHCFWWENRETTWGIGQPCFMTPSYAVDPDPYPEIRALHHQWLSTSLLCQVSFEVSSKILSNCSHWVNPM